MAERVDSHNGLEKQILRAQTQLKDLTDPKRRLAVLSSLQKILDEGLFDQYAITRVIRLPLFGDILRSLDNPNWRPHEQSQTIELLFTLSTSHHYEDTDEMTRLGVLPVLLKVLRQFNKLPTDPFTAKSDAKPAILAQNKKLVKSISHVFSALGNLCSITETCWVAIGAEAHVAIQVFLTRYRKFPIAVLESVTWSMRQLATRGSDMIYRVQSLAPYAIHIMNTTKNSECRSSCLSVLSSLAATKDPDESDVHHFKGAAAVLKPLLVLGTDPQVLYQALLAARNLLRVDLIRPELIANGVIDQLSRLLDPKSGLDREAYENVWMCFSFLFKDHAAACIRLGVHEILLEKWNSSEEDYDMQEGLSRTMIAILRDSPESEFATILCAPYCTVYLSAVMSSLFHPLHPLYGSEMILKVLNFGHQLGALQRDTQDPDAPDNPLNPFVDLVFASIDSLMDRNRTWEVPTTLKQAICSAVSGVLPEAFALEIHS